MAIAMVSALVGGCATTNYDRYPYYEHRVCPTPNLGLATADRETRDCGLLDDGDDAAARERMLACARSAYDSARPFRFGRGFIGVDWGECTVAVRTRDGQIWSMEFGYDYSSCPADKTQCPRLFVGRCDKLEFGDGPMVFYRVAGCTPDSAGFERERESADW
jgi:hypothetical protein